MTFDKISRKLSNVRRNRGNVPIDILRLRKRKFHILTYARDTGSNILSVRLKHNCRNEIKKNTRKDVFVKKAEVQYAVHKSE